MKQIDDGRFDDGRFEDIGAAAPTPTEGFQEEVDRWLIACFGEAIARDKVERNHRFIEEALELVQAGGCTASEAHQLVDYVFNRPVGEMWQEVGGVMNTLAALCLAHSLDMDECGQREIARCWTKVDKIRAKHAAKPKHSPLPEAPAPEAVKPVVPDWKSELTDELQAMAKQVGMKFVPFDEFKPAPESVKDDDHLPKSK